LDAASIRGRERRPVRAARAARGVDERARLPDRDHVLAESAEVARRILLEREGGEAARSAVAARDRDQRASIRGHELVARGSSREGPYADDGVRFHRLEERL